MRIFINSENLKNLPENTVYIHVSNEISDHDSYIDLHIGDAHFLSVEGDLAGEVRKDTGRHPLPDMESFIKKISQFGIDIDTPVLVYSDSVLMNATRAWWMLKLIGVEGVFVLYDGLKGYLEKDFPIRSGEVKSNPIENHSLKINNDLYVDIDFVKETTDSEDVLLMDARDSDRFDGIKDTFDNVPGHIPSAKNYCFADIVSEDLPDLKEIEEFFKNVDRDKEVIIYCGSGMSATVNAAFLYEIGIIPKVYVGSYSEWVRQGNEIE